MRGDTGDGEAVSIDRTISERVRDALLSGLAVTVPIVVTLLVIGFSVEFLSDLLDPFVLAVNSVIPGQPVSAIAVKLVTLGVVLAAVLVTGVVVEQSPARGPTKRQFDSALARIPGIGTVYKSFVDMSDTLLRADTDAFESVKLVEYDEPDVYAIAFRTSQTPDSVLSATGCAEMETLFVPSAPNPMLGGEVLYVSTDRIVDVDMTVAEGIRAVVTSGAASDDSDRVVANPDGSRPRNIANN